MKYILSGFGHLGPNGIQNSNIAAVFLQGIAIFALGLLLV
jgi:hypothetical protein